ncbi:MAG: hypothetical protein DWI21_04320 [Planctomycetota bacterium]|nr:MAG: hypothetical protein DWI21_04320 [Planctomycetota bacterium]
MPQVLQSARLCKLACQQTRISPKDEFLRPANDLQLFSKSRSSLARALQLISLAVVAGVGPQLQTSANPKTL